MDIINIILETLFNMLKRWDCRKDILNYNRIDYLNIHVQLPRNAILMIAKIIAGSIWKRCMLWSVLLTHNTTMR